MASRLTLASAHDLDLAGQCRAGDRAAFGELVRRHGSAVRSFVRRMGADAATADDVAQDAFLTAFEQIADFRGEGAFQGWVKRIAARAYARRWRQEGRLDSRDPAGESGDASVGAQETGAAARLDLDEALKSLPESERLCVSLCYGAGLSHAEAAAVLNAPLGTVKSHVKRGLDRLRQRLSSGDDDGHRRQVNG